MLAISNITENLLYFYQGLHDQNLLHLILASFILEGYPSFVTVRTSEGDNGLLDIGWEKLFADAASDMLQCKRGVALPERFLE